MISRSGVFGALELHRRGSSGSTCPASASTTHLSESQRRTGDDLQRRAVPASSNSAFMLFTDTRSNGRFVRPQRARQFPHAVAERILVAIVGDHPAARHAAELAQHAPARLAIDMEQETDAHEAVRRLRAERQRLGVGAHVAGDVGVLHGRQFRRLLHHLDGDVAAHHLVARAREIAGEAAGAAGQIDDGLYALGERQRFLDRVPLARVAALALRRAEAMLVVVGRDFGALIELLLVRVAVCFRLRRIVAGRLFGHRRNLTCRLRTRARNIGGACRGRTYDLLIKSQLLYQLS